MPNTRHQNPEERQFRQDAFASSAEYERGVLGNLVAARCQKLSDPDEIAMLWWLQQISWRDGGMERFAAEFLDANRERLGTPSMFKFGAKVGQIYTSAQVRTVRAEIGEPWAQDFPLKGEVEEADPMVGLVAYDNPARRNEARAKAAGYPTSYPATAFVKACRLDDRRFAQTLKCALVDPQSESLRNGLWYFPTLWDALCSLRQREIAAARERIVETAITRQVYEELDFARETRSFVLIEGREGIGKSEAARAWSDQHPGQAVYVRLESGSDEMTLYRAIARRIGTACSYARKAAEMRARIQDALQPGNLMLVLDEAHFLWPQSQSYQGSVPKRLDWLRTALVDFSVPVALVSTPQFFARQCDRFRKAGWNANQIQRRLTRTMQLPEDLSKKDAIAIAKRYFPSVSAQDATRIAGAALITLGYLSTIVNLRKRVDFLASRRPGVAEVALVALALDEILVRPSRPPATSGRPVATPMPATCRGSAIPSFPAPGVPANRLANLVQQPELSPV